MSRFWECELFTFSFREKPSRAGAHFFIFFRHSFFSLPLLHLAMVLVLAIHTVGAVTAKVRAQKGKEKGEAR